jgi:hypothetical protein
MPTDPDQLKVEALVAEASRRPSRTLHIRDALTEALAVAVGGAALEARPVLEPELVPRAGPCCGLEAQSVTPVGSGGVEKRAPEPEPRREVAGNSERGIERAPVPAEETRVMPPRGPGRDAPR